MEKKYIAPEIKVIEIEKNADVIQTSTEVISAPKMLREAAQVATQTIDVFAE